MLNFNKVKMFFISIFIMAQLFTFISHNIGANNTTFGGLVQMIQCQKPDLIFLQEVTVSSETLAEFVRKYGYTAVSNIDIRDDKTLGTAVVWRLGVPVQTVNEIELCRIQEVIVGTQPFLNIYAPAGKNYQGGRRQFFGQNVFRAIGNRNNVILAGDFNCILKEIDTEGNFQDKKCLVLMFLVTKIETIRARVILARIAFFAIKKKSKL